MSSLFFAADALLVPLLAQSGGAKTAVGWVLVLLAVALGLLVVGRPSGRKHPDGDQRR